MVSLAIDEAVEAPASEAEDDQVHEQVQEQQWSRHVPPHRCHSLCLVSFLEDTNSGQKS